MLIGEFEELPCPFSLACRRGETEENFVRIRVCPRGGESSGKHDYLIPSLKPQNVSLKCYPVLFYLKQSFIKCEKDVFAEL